MVLSMPTAFAVSKAESQYTSHLYRNGCSFSYKELQSEFQNIGENFQTYFLLELPTDKANQILFKKLKENEIVRANEAADKALKNYKKK